VLQPVEHYQTRRDPDRVVPIYYSLGNLTNPFALAFMLRSGVARLVVAKGTRNDGSTHAYVRSAEMIAVDQVIEPGTAAIALRTASMR
jgi:hypothetical protein